MELSKTVKLGEYGEASAEIMPSGKLKISLAAHAEVDLIAELKKLAAKTSTPLDDQAIAWIEGMLAKA